MPSRQRLHRPGMQPERERSGGSEHPVVESRRKIARPRHRRRMPARARVGAPVGVGDVDVGHAAEPCAHRQRDPEVADDHRGPDRTKEGEIVIDIALQGREVVDRLVLAPARAGSRRWGSIGSLPCPTRRPDTAPRIGDPPPGSAGSRERRAFAPARSAGRRAPASRLRRRAGLDGWCHDGRESSPMHFAALIDARPRHRAGAVVSSPRCDHGARIECCAKGLPGMNYDASCAKSGPHLDEQCFPMSRRSREISAG